jgi:hypothetical protein
MNVLPTVLKSQSILLYYTTFQETRHAIIKHLPVGAYVCTYVCMCVYVCIYVCMCVFMYECMYVSQYICTLGCHVLPTQSVPPFITSTLSAESRSLSPQHNALSPFEDWRRLTDNDHSILNKQQPPTADRRCSSDMGVGRGPNYYTAWIFRNDLTNGKHICVWKLECRESLLVRFTEESWKRIRELQVSCTGSTEGPTG